jgi:transposase
LHIYPNKIIGNFMDYINELFSAALGISKPIFISNIAFNLEAGELHIRLDLPRGSRLTCPICGLDELRLHDRQEKQWRHMNFFQYKTYLHFAVPRIGCPKCGVHLWNVPWARPESGFTLLLELFVMILAQEMAVLQIAELIDEHDTKIWRIILHYIRILWQSESWADVEAVGVDETSCRKGHHYITVFVDMAAKRVLFATEGKDAQTVVEFTNEMRKHGADPSQVTEVTMDMSPAFINGVTAFLPNASITFDKFHVIKQLNEAVDLIRRSEAKINPLLKGTRYLWLKNPENLKSHQLEELKSISKENTKTGRAYRMKLTFQDIYSCIVVKEDAVIAMHKWLSWANRSRLEEIKEFSGMVNNVNRLRICRLNAVLTVILAPAGVYK